MSERRRPVVPWQQRAIAATGVRLAPGGCAPPTLGHHRNRTNIRPEGAHGDRVRRDDEARDGLDTRTARRAPRRTWSAELEAAFEATVAARGPGRAAGLDARGLPQDAGPPDRPARALRDHRHAAGGQLDHPRARACGARRSCWPRCRTRPATGCTSTRAAETLGVDRAELLEKLHRRQAEVLLDLQLPDADLGRHRRHRLAGRRRGDHATRCRCAAAPTAPTPAPWSASARRSPSTSGRASSC